MHPTCDTYRHALYYYQRNLCNIKSDQTFLSQESGEIYLLERAHILCIYWKSRRHSCLLIWHVFLNSIRFYGYSRSCNGSVTNWLMLFLLHIVKTRLGFRGYQLFLLYFQIFRDYALQHRYGIRFLPILRMFRILCYMRCL